MIERKSGRAQLPPVQREPAECESTMVSDTARPVTIRHLGWTSEEAAEIRASLVSFAEDWDDPAMDVYDR